MNLVNCICGLEYDMMTDKDTCWRCFDCNRYVMYDSEFHTIKA